MRRRWRLAAGAAVVLLGVVAALVVARARQVPGVAHLITATTADVRTTDTAPPPEVTGTSARASASSDGRRLFAVARSGRVVALDARDGNRLWSYRLGALTYGTPSVANGRVFVGTMAGGVYALQAWNGRRVRTFKAGKYAPGIVTRERYYLSLNGLLVAFHGRFGPKR